MEIDLACWGRDLNSYVANAVAAERAGIRRVWSAELHRSPFVPLAAVATATETIEIGTGIALAYVRSPMAIATAALDLDELSDGRFTLGLGSGVKTLIERHHDAEFSEPVTRLSDTIAIVRALMGEMHTGDRIGYEGRTRSLDLRGYRRPHPPVRGPVPVAVAGVGPRMIGLAGAEADAWIGHELMSPEYLRSVVLPGLHRGKESAGRDSDPAVIVSASTSIHSDRATAYRRAAATVAFYASVKTYEPFFAFHGFEKEAGSIRDLFRAGEHAAMVDVVPNEMVDAVAIAGTPSDLAEKLAPYRDLADTVKLGPTTYLLTNDEVQQSVDAIITSVAALTMEAM
ncbi:MAG: LLM class flavin-dependent oxidoreductase [Acidimicrobiia bacterium]